MGRSVDYLNNALRVAYVSYEDTYEDEDGEVVVDEMAFDDLFGDIEWSLVTAFPSLNVANMYGLTIVKSKERPEFEMLHFGANVKL